MQERKRGLPHSTYQLRRLLWTARAVAAAWATRPRTSSLLSPLRIELEG